MLDGMGNINKITGQAPEPSEMKPLSVDSFGIKPENKTAKQNILEQLQLVAKDQAALTKTHNDLYV